MKRIVISILAVVFAAMSVSAQNKGDMYVSGILNLGLNSSGSTVRSSYKSDWEIETETVNGFNFGISPKFGYFVADNFEVNVALRYNYGLESHPESYKDSDGNKDNNKLNYNNNTFMVAPGISYYFPIISEKLYYVPSFGLGIGATGGSIKYIGGNNRTDKIKSSFAFGFFLDFLSFEYKMSAKMALTANIGGLSYTMATRSETKDEVKTAVTNNIVDFGFDKVSLGFKYYF
jgi:hypothetical protein